MSVAAVAEAMSAAVAAADAVVAGAAAVAGGAPTSISSRTSSRWCGSDNGLELYRFRYKGSDHTIYVGVMAQEVQNIDPSAVWRDRDGYLRVDYDRIGVKFMTWKEWVARSGAGSVPRRLERETDGVAMLKKASRILLYAALLGWSAPSLAQEQFKTPEAAVDALVAAAKVSKR